ncbi:tRNA-dihydrouridine synthase [Platysternon megacephalum]|uniref:tRNA-dihydrouridine synthase n=1 Tax=Platysternon megacephalum TaxID=55544 RepID=A0A4D9DLB8_9SAUR|nr:tRNA-dihydrouridine synthase [Platysternon megacephalum]
MPNSCGNRKLESMLSDELESKPEVSRSELGESVHLCSGDGQPKDSSPIPHLSRVEKKLKCTVEGCDRTFVWPAHFKYHLKTHRNDRSFTCPAEGCGKSFYVLQRLKVHMRTHNGEKPFVCTEVGCGKQFTTAGNLKNHLRIHTGAFKSQIFFIQETLPKKWSRESSVHMYLHRCPHLPTYNYLSM